MAALAVSYFELIYLIKFQNKPNWLKKTKKKYQNQS